MNDEKNKSLSNGRIRHRAEKVMVAIAVVWIIILVLAAAILLYAHVAGIQEMDSDTSNTVILIASLLIFVPIAKPFLGTYTFWKEVVDAVEVTPRNYPDIYAIFKEQALKLGFKEGKMPRLFLTNGMGIMNAHAVRYGLVVRHYILLNSDIVDVYSEVWDEKNEEALRFTISHELGHIKLGHTSIPWTVMEAFMKYILLGPTMTRVCEYSADRAAASVCKQGHYTDVMVALLTGKYQFKYMNIDAFYEDDVKEKSVFWIKLVNFMADHPVGRRRVETLYRMDKEGWEGVHGKIL